MYSAAIYFGAKYFNIDISDYLLQFMYNCMFAFSCAQIMIQNSPLIKRLEDIIKPIQDQLTNEIEVISNNSVIYTTKTRNFLEHPPTYFDLVIYSAENEKSRCINKVVFYEIPTVVQFSYQRCNYRFIQATIQISYMGMENKLKLDLENDRRTYYIVNNKLNPTFIGYYLNKYHDIFYNMYELDKIHYKIFIIDHNVNQIEVTELQELIFGENDYTIQEMELVSEPEPESEPTTDS